jgi:hypothetical protein
MIKILSIKGIKKGNIVTRVYPANGYSGDSSYIGMKMELIKLTKTEIILKSLEGKENDQIYLSLKNWEFGWVQYKLSGDEKYKKSKYSERRGQLRVQYVYLGFELDKLRGRNYPDDKFGDYLMICRYLEEYGYSC